MPLYATLLNVTLVIVGIPNSNPRTDHRGCAIEFVLFSSLAFHLLAKRHSLSIFVLIQGCICSNTAMIMVIIDVTHKILVSGHSLPIHVELGSESSYFVMLRSMVITSIANTLSLKTCALCLADSVVIGILESTTLRSSKDTISEFISAGVDYLHWEFHDALSCSKPLFWLSPIICFLRQYYGKHNDRSTIYAN